MSHTPHDTGARVGRGRHGTNRACARDARVLCVYRVLYSARVDYCACVRAFQSRARVCDKSVAP